MFDIIEVFTSSLRKPLRCIVQQTRDADSAQVAADKLWQENKATAHAESTYIVYDRSTQQEIYRIPEALAETS